LILVLDVARYKYPPHWVPLEMMYRSMCRTDPDTKKSRGWMVVKPQSESKSLLFMNHDNVTTQPTSNKDENKKIATHNNSYPKTDDDTKVSLLKTPEDYNPKPSRVDYDIAKIYYTQVSNVLCSEECQCKDNVKDALEFLFLYLPLPISEVLNNYGEKFGMSLSVQQQHIRDDILISIQNTPIYLVVKDILEKHTSLFKDTGEYRTQMITLLVLIIPEIVWRKLSPNISGKIIEMTKIDPKYTALKHEVQELRHQLRFLRDLKFPSCSC